MNKQRLLLITLLLLSTLSAALYARGDKEESKLQILQITGVVRLVGTDLFPELVITTNNGEWYIANDERDKLHDLQHRTVTVEGEETILELKFASGMPAGTKRILRNVRIIRVTQ
jgi:hypothetical protein